MELAQAQIQEIIKDLVSAVTAKILFKEAIGSVDDGGLFTILLKPRDQTMKQFLKQRFSSVI